MGIRVESNVLPKDLFVEAGQLRYRQREFNGIAIILDGSGPGLGGSYLVRRLGLFGLGREEWEGSVENGEINKVIVSGRLFTFTGT